MTLTRTRIGVGDVRISEAAKLNVLDVLREHRLSYGRYSKEFERRFAALHGREFAVFVNSGTDALRIGLAAMKEKYGWKDGDVVLVPALTFVASFNVIEQVGLRPMLVDIDRYYGMDPQEVGAILGRYSAADYPLPVAMMPVHLFGQTASTSLLVLAAAFGLKVIADSCESVAVRGCAVGEVSCFSTYACHHIHTGVGGLATTSDPRLAEIIRSLANHGRDGIYTGIDQELGSHEVIAGRFRFERMGYSSRVTEMEAAIGCAELDVLDQNLSRRREIAEYMIERLSDLPISLPEVRENSEHSWMMFPVKVRSGEERDGLIQHLESAGIETRYSLPLTSQPYIRKMLGDSVEARFPAARIVNERGFYWGCHQHLSDEEVEHICRTVRSFYS